MTILLHSLSLLKYGWNLTDNDSGYLAEIYAGERSCQPIAQATGHTPIVALVNAITAAGIQL